MNDIFLVAVFVVLLISAVVAACFTAIGVSIDELRHEIWELRMDMKGEQE